MANTPDGTPLVQMAAHPVWMAEARAMADRPSAVAAGLTIDQTYKAIAILGIYDGRALTSNALSAGVDELGGRAFFETTEAIDTLLTHGDETQARKAAAFAIEFADISPTLPDPESKQATLTGVLGIEFGTETLVEEQVVRKYLLPEGSNEEVATLGSLICRHVRTRNSNL